MREICPQLTPISPYDFPNEQKNQRMENLVESIKHGREVKLNFVRAQNGMVFDFNKSAVDYSSVVAPAKDVLKANQKAMEEMVVKAAELRQQLLPESTQELIQSGVFAPNPVTETLEEP